MKNNYVNNLNIPSIKYCKNEKERLKSDFIIILFTDMIIHTCTCATCTDCLLNESISHTVQYR